MANQDLLEMLQRVMGEIVDAKAKKLSLDYDNPKHQLMFDQIEADIELASEQLELIIINET
jgi:hypothetical protein|tara:strand:- start:383 stop:565 length:183 start_codon:yes stop_codon:yes gene_type:complete